MYIILYQDKQNDFRY